MEDCRMPSDYEAITIYNEDQLGKDTASRKSQVNMYSDFSHFVFEILQNADDYEATTITFNLSPEELIIDHNGTTFREENVRAVSYFGESTSRDDLIKAGRFGLGFKSVFAFTATPAIHSGEENFQIYNLYRMKALSRPDNIETGKTRIYLPFDHIEKRPDFVETLVPKKTAFDKISRRLKELDSTTLLFTRNILEIKWTMPNEEGGYLRGDKDKENINEYLKTRKTEITDGNFLHTYLVFSRSVKWEGEQYRPVEIAFLLDKDSDYKKIRSIKKPLSVLFPTTKETNMGFLINGPFRTPPHRETVSQDDEFNKFLIDETAQLLSNTLSEIREMGLLSVSFLEALPIRLEAFPQDSLFRPIYEKVQTVLKEQNFLPTANDGYVAGKNAVLARGAELRKILTHDQLRELFPSCDDIKWLSGEITQDRTPDLHFYLTKKLDVKEVRPETFVELITDEFLQTKIDKWIIQFYNFLGNDKSELWKKTDSILRKKKILRLEDNSHVIPFQADGWPNAYLPSSPRTNLPTIKKNIFEDKGAENFLRNFGLFEPDLFAEVIEFVLPKYTDLSISVNLQENLEDLRKISKILSAPLRSEAKNSIGKLDILLAKLGLNKLSVLSEQNEPAKFAITSSLKKAVFSSIKFIRAVNDDIKEYSLAKDIYFNTDELHMYFENNPNVWFVEKDYPEDLDLLFKELSVGESPRVTRKQDDKGYVIVQKCHGEHKRGLNGFDPDIEIYGLEYALAHPTIKKSLFIWNYIALPNDDCIHGIVESSSRKTYEGSRKEEQVSEKFGRLLIEIPWLPDKQGNFYKPSEIRLDDLPESFVHYEKLSNQLGMKKNIVARLAEEAGISQDTIKIAKELENHPELLEEFRKKIQPVASDRKNPETATVHDKMDYEDELQKSFNKPGETELQEQIIDNGKVRNSEHRRGKSYEGDKERFHAEPKPEERRKETIRTILEGPDEQVRKYLSQLYAGKCQMCGKTFAERDGNPFFIANYIVPRKFARSADNPANALCLCADHFAKWQHGTVETENILKQIESFKTESEGGNSNPALMIKLCAEECKIQFKEKHLLELQELLRASES